MDFFKELVLRNGLQRLKTEFHELGESRLLDTSKGRSGYDSEEEIYYLFYENPSTQEISGDSFPYKFRNKLRKRLKIEYEIALVKLDRQVEKRQQVESMKKYLRSTYTELSGLIKFADQSEVLNEYPSINATLTKLLESVSVKIESNDFKVPSKETPNVFRRKKYRNPPDQDKVLNAVKQLITQPRFLNSSGKPKPTTITKELLDSADSFGLNIAISDRRMFNRVKDALAEIEFYDVESTS